MSDHSDTPRDARLRSRIRSAEEFTITIFPGEPPVRGIVKDDDWVEASPGDLVEMAQRCLAALPDGDPRKPTRDVVARLREQYDANAANIDREWGGFNDQLSFALHRAIGMLEPLQPPDSPAAEAEEQGRFPALTGIEHRSMPPVPDVPFRSARLPT